MNFIIQKLKNKHTCLKKYSNWAKLSSLAEKESERIFSILQWIWTSFRSWSLWFPSLLLQSRNRIVFYENSSNFWFRRIPSADHSPTFLYFLPCRSRFDCIFVIWKILRCVSSKTLLVHLIFHECLQLIMAILSK